MEARPSILCLPLPQWFGCKLLPSLWSFNKTSTLCCARSLWPRPLAAPVPSLDETVIQKRFDEFQSVFRFKPYERRKSALEQLGRSCVSHASRRGFSKSSFFSVPYSGLGSVKSGTGAASFHNLVLRDRVTGVQWGYFTNITGTLSTASAEKRKIKSVIKQQ